MNITTRLIAASDIAHAINRDLDNDPNFTMTRSQLRARIAAHCDDPSTTRDDRRRIFCRLALDPAMPLR